MFKNIALVLAFSFFVMPVSVMADADAQHNHDPALVGEWFATASDGSLTELVLESGGKFILGRRNGKNIERSYMCGTWERAGNKIDLDIQAKKTRAADGQTKVAKGHTNGKFTVLKATANTLIIRIDHKVVSLFRNA